MASNKDKDQKKNKKGWLQKETEAFIYAMLKEIEKKEVQKIKDELNNLHGNYNINL